MVGLSESKAKPTLSTSALAAAPRALPRPKIKRDPDDYGPTVPLAPDSDDDFNPAPAADSRSPRKRAKASSPPPAPAGGRKKARASAALEVEQGRSRSSSPKKRGAGGSKRFRFGVDSSDDDDVLALPGPSTRRPATAKRKEDEGDGDDDDFDRAARKKRSGKRLHMRTAAQREAVNPLRLLAGKSPLSDSDDALDALTETRAIVGVDGILRRVKVDRPPQPSTPSSIKGKEREVIRVDGSETGAYPVHMPD
jgi:hypothetical protein